MAERQLWGKTSLLEGDGAQPQEYTQSILHVVLYPLPPPPSLFHRHAILINYFWTIKNGVANAVQPKRHQSGKIPPGKLERGKQPCSWILQKQQAHDKQHFFCFTPKQVQKRILAVNSSKCHCLCDSSSDFVRQLAIHSIWIRFSIFINTQPSIMGSN